MPAHLVEETRQDPHELALLAEGEAFQGARGGRHTVDEEGAEPSPGGSEDQYLHAAIRGRRAATHETPGFEPVHEAGDVRRVAGKGLGQPPHRNGPLGLDQVEHVTLGRGELELGGERREVRPLGKEQAEQERPGSALRRSRRLHPGQYSAVKDD